MKMKPILFNGDMVRALLDNRKTVTRRIVKPQPEERPVPGEDGCYIYRGIPCGLNGMTNLAPYRPGDILYVRETFKIDFLSNIPGSGRIRYKADDTYGDFTFAPERYEMMRRAQLKSGWRPNENMPREAARIFLRVTSVRVERLQSILYEPSGAECQIVKEGCKYASDFPVIWDRTVKPADRARFGWDANPWVWVIEFERFELTPELRKEKNENLL